MNRSGTDIWRVATIAIWLSIALPAHGFAGTTDITVMDVWSRASIGTSRPSAAYLTVRNNGGEMMTLVRVRSEIAARSEIHRSSTNEQGVSSMAPAGDIEILPGQTVTLQPGGLHVMLMGLQQPMAESDTFMLWLVFADGNEISVEVPILGLAARGPTK